MRQDSGILLVFSLLLIATIGCSWGSRRTQTKPAPSLTFSENSGEAHAQLLKEIPIGTDLFSATNRLEVLGFRVSKDSPEKYFARLDRAKGAFVEVSWLVTLHGDEQKVRDLEVKVAYTGP